MQKFLNYGFVNRAFTFFCFAAVPALGSVVSFVWHGAALWCLFEIVSGRRKFSRDDAMWLLAVLIVLYCAANIFATLWYSQTYGGLDKMLRLGTLLLFPFSYSIWAISEKAAITRSVVLASMVGCYAGLALALIQVHMFDLRAEGGAGNAIVFAFAISLAGSMSLAGLLSQDDKLRLPLAGAFLASWIALFYSSTRFMWITTLPVNLMVLWIYRRHLVRLASPRVLILGGLGVLIALAAGYPMVVARFSRMAFDVDQMMLKDNYGTSVGARLSLIEMALNLISHHPFIGYGLGATRQLISEGFDEMFDLSYSYSHFHNGALTTMVESGFFGLVALVAIFVAATRNAVRVLRGNAGPSERFGATMLLVVVATYGFGSLANKVLGHDIQDTIFIMFLILGTYLASGTSRLGESVSAEPSTTRRPSEPVTVPAQQ